MKNIIVTTQTNWVSEEVKDAFSDELETRVVKDYGFDVPEEATDVYSWWIPAAHAARVLEVKPNLTFIAPSFNWLDGLGAYTGREVKTSKVSDLLEKGAWDGNLWLKPAESKIETFPAQPWKFGDWEAMARSLEPSLTVQSNDTIMDFVSEHRFYVVNGEIITGSPYLVDGVTWNDGLVFDDLHEQARMYARNVAHELQDAQPPAYTLDVGWDRTREKFYVVEGNPAWCSGFYGSDIKLAFACIHEAMKHSTKWDWKPDSQLDLWAKKKKKLVLM